MSNDAMDFLSKEPKNESSSQQPTKAPWKILVLDDEEEVIRSTKVLLEDFEFLNRKTQLYAFTRIDEGKKFLQENPDTALILLDVVMEDMDSGLKFVGHVRETLKNRNVRIMLRTGQPGKAPEVEVMETYDINDYKAKTNLDMKTLLGAIRSALKTYQEIVENRHYETGLEKINRLEELLSAPSNKTSTERVIPSYTNKSIELLMSILYHEDETIKKSSGFIGFFTIGSTTQKILVVNEAIVSSFDDYELYPFYLLSRKGYFTDKEDQHISTSVQSHLQRCLDTKESLYEHDWSVIYSSDPRARCKAGETLVYLEHHDFLTERQRQLAVDFLTNLILCYKKYWQIFSTPTLNSLPRQGNE